MEFSIPNINLDMILSDPMLLTAMVFLVLGPVVFLIALWKMIALRKKSSSQFVVPTDLNAAPPSMSPMPPPPPANPPEPLPHPFVREAAPPPPETVQPPAPETSSPPLAKESAPAVKSNDAFERTVVLPPGVAELQAQMEIAFSQIKNLNKQVHGLEAEIESLMRQQNTKLESHPLKEPPMNAEEFSKKLIAVAEHVVALEKEMARLKDELKGSRLAPTPPASEKTSSPHPKPPVMPL